MPEISHLRVDPARLQRALARLPEADRDAFLLKVSDGLSYAAIGERFGVTAERAEAQVACALVKLDAALARDERPWWRVW